jgi:uncharacterized membrane protein YbhN (UPF0104 family)
MLAAMPNRPGVAGRLARLTPAIGLGCFAIAAYVLGRTLSHLTLADLRQDLAHFPSERIVLALILTGLDFTPLFGLDWFALQVIGRKAPIRRLALASVVGYAFSRAVGLSVLSGGAIRYRLLGPVGFDLIDVARLVGVAAVISWLGFLLVGGTALIGAPATALTALHLSRCLRARSGVSRSTLAAFIVISARMRRPIRSARAAFLPKPADALATGVAAADWIPAPPCLTCCSPAGVGFAQFVAVFMTAGSGVVVGAGRPRVFETVILLLLGPAYDQAIVGSLLLYRLLYYTSCRWRWRDPPLWHEVQATTPPARPDRAGRGSVSGVDSSGRSSHPESPRGKPCIQRVCGSPALSAPSASSSHPPGAGPCFDVVPVQNGGQLTIRWFMPASR